jgi:gamma-carbonic anhydrase
MGDLTKQLETFLSRTPSRGQRTFIAHGAVVLGDVALGDFSSVWYNAVIRGDINRISVGHHTNIQDNAVLHVADAFDCQVGNFVTVGHSAIVHACKVEDEVLVGMGCTILDGAVVGARSIIGAKALIKQGMQIPPGSLVMGVPGRIVRALSPEEQSGIRGLAEKYVQAAAFYLDHGIRPLLT